MTARAPEPAYIPAPVRAPEPAVLGPLPANPNMAAATEIQGFVGACLVDGDSGLMLASEGGGQIDMEAAAALDSEVVKAEREAMALMGLDDHIEDILVTLGK